MRVLREALTRPGAPLGRAVVALAALAGLFAMHGLGDHGSAHDPASTMAQHGHAMSDEMAPGDATGSPAPGHHHMTSMVGLCLAVLGAVLLLAWSVGRAYGDARASIRRTVALLRATPTAARDPVGPDRLRLSVHRC